jgi:hypothetical protein
MKTLASALLVTLLTGCAGYGNWSPTQQVKASDGSTWTWIAPLPATANNTPGFVPNGVASGVYSNSFTVTSGGRSTGVTVSGFR